MERIQKILAESGIGSRRHSEELITAGRVTVNGRIAKIGESASLTDNIRVDGEPLSREKMRYIMLFKPEGYICSAEETEGRLVTDLVNVPERLFTVGRLDKDSEGLIILTNDGTFAQLISHPSNEVSKTYFVRLRNSLLPADCQRITNGIKLRYFQTHPAKLRILSGRRDVVEISLHEGQHKVVKLLFKAVGNRVNYLQRTAIGPVKLRGIKVGKWRDLTAEEIKLLRSGEKNLYPRHNKEVKGDTHGDKSNR